MGEVACPGHQSGSRGLCGSTASVSRNAPLADWRWPGHPGYAGGCASVSSVPKNTLPTAVGLLGLAPSVLLPLPTRQAGPGSLRWQVPQQGVQPLSPGCVVIVLPLVDRTRRYAADAPDAGGPDRLLPGAHRKRKHCPVSTPNLPRVPARPTSQRLYRQPPAAGQGYPEPSPLPDGTGLRSSSGFRPWPSSTPVAIMVTERSHQRSVPMRRYHSGRRVPGLDDHR